MTEWSIWQYPEGSTVRDFTDAQSGLRGVVRRGGWSFCAYVGVPSDHILAALEELDFACHRGITWRRWGDDQILPKEYFWWGWDYGHAGDAHAIPEEYVPKFVRDELFGGKQWEPEEIIEEILDVMMELKTRLLESSTVLAALTAHP